MDYTPLGSTHPKAQKEYECEWCGLKIVVGEVHERWTNVYEGSAHNHRVHAVCLGPLSDSVDPIEGYFCPESPNHEKGGDCPTEEHF